MRRLWDDKKEYAKSAPAAKEARARYYQRNKGHWDRVNHSWKINRRMGIIAAMGGKCVWCGYDDARALCFDHIKDDGAQDRRKRGLHSIYYVMESPGRFQLLCCNCNWIKERERRNALKKSRPAQADGGRCSQLDVFEESRNTAVCR